MSMNVNDFYSSDYLKAADLDSDLQVTISRVEAKALGGDDESGKQAEVKPVIHFNGLDKGLVCNKTNAMEIARSYGMDMEQWAGNDLVLYTTSVTFQGS